MEQSGCLFQNPSLFRRQNFFLLSLFLSPLVGLIVLLIVGKNEPHVVEVRYADASKSDSEAEASAAEEKTE